MLLFLKPLIGFTATTSVLTSLMVLVSRGFHPSNAGMKLPPLQ